MTKMVYNIKDGYQGLPQPDQNVEIFPSFLMFDSIWLHFKVTVILRGLNLNSEILHFLIFLAPVYSSYVPCLFDTELKAVFHLDSLGTFESIWEEIGKISRKHLPQKCNNFYQNCFFQECSNAIVSATALSPLNPSQRIFLLIAGFVTAQKNKSTNFS